MSRVAALALSLSLAVPSGGFEAIASRAGARSHDASCARMQAWVDAHPRDPRAGRGLVWMAELRLVDARADLALPLFARAARDFAGSEWGWEGEKGVADLDLARHSYASAIATYDRLATLPGPYWRYVGRTSAKAARAARRRWHVFLLLAALLTIGLGVRLFRARRALWPPPEELTYALPVAAVMLLACLRQPAGEAHAVATVALGALVLLYAHGVHLRARAASAPARALEALLGLCEAAALLYCAVVASGLWARFAETLTSGAER